MTDQVQPPTAPANRLLFNMSGVKMGSLDRDADGTRSARWHEFSASRNFSTPDRKSFVAHVALGNYSSRRYSTAPVRKPRLLAGFPARFLAPIAI
jgi:hypothetical protein